MKLVSKSGLADGLFAGWRYLTSGTRELDPDFVLNRPPFNKASILIAGPNFGCGSSREHAVWALKEWGIRAILAPSFGSIFRSNCQRNGVLPVVLDEITIGRIANAVSADPLSNRVIVDLERRCVALGRLTWPFEIPEDERQMLLKGLDEIALTLQSEAEIKLFEIRDRAMRPWAAL